MAQVSIKKWPLPNGIKRPNENSQTSKGLTTVRAAPSTGKGGGGQKDAKPS